MMTAGIPVPGADTRTDGVGVGDGVAETTVGVGVAVWAGTGVGVGPNVFNVVLVDTQDSFESESYAATAR